MTVNIYNIKHMSVVVYSLNVIFLSIYSAAFRESESNTSLYTLK